MSVFDTPALLDIGAEEAEVMRVFAVAPASPEEARLANAASAGGMALAEEAGALFGGVRLDPGWLELIALRDVEEMGGLEAYLQAGYDPPETAMEVLRPALEVASRHVLLVLTRAFEERPLTLRPDPALTALAAASLRRQPPVATPLAPAEPEIAAPADEAPPPKPPMSEGRISGMVAMAALAVAAGLVVVMVLVAG